MRFTLNLGGHTWNVPGDVAILHSVAGSTVQVIFEPLLIRQSRVVRIIFILSLLTVDFEILSVHHYPALY